MRYLLDTHTFLWWCLGAEELSPHARAIIADGRNEIYFSAASAWEIAIKTAKGRLSLPEEPGHYVASRMHLHRFLALPVQISHALRVYDLPSPPCRPIRSPADRAVPDGVHAADHQRQRNSPVPPGNDLVNFGRPKWETGWFRNKFA